jgi:hypothetical protein
MIRRLLGVLTLATMAISLAGCQVFELLISAPEPTPGIEEQGFQELWANLVIDGIEIEGPTSTMVSVPLALALRVDAHDDRTGAPVVDPGHTRVLTTIWSVQPSDGADVEGGWFSASKPGNYVVTVSEYGKSDSHTITVTAATGPDDTSERVVTDPGQDASQLSPAPSPSLAPSPSSGPSPSSAPSTESERTLSTVYAGTYEGKWKTDGVPFVLRFKVDEDGGVAGTMRLDADGLLVDFELDGTVTDDGSLAAKVVVVAVSPASFYREYVEAMLKGKPTLPLKGTIVDGVMRGTIKGTETVKVTAARR